MPSSCILLVVIIIRNIRRRFIFVGTVKFSITSSQL